MNNTTIQFSKEHNSDFYKTLKSRVNAYFKENNIAKTANSAMVFKTFALLALFLTPYGFLYNQSLPMWAYYILWAIMGFGMAGVGLSVMHDANHGAYSRKEWVNTLVSNVMILLGGSARNWRIQHNVLHHTYTNVTDHDEDIDPPLFMLRFSPHSKHYAIHKFQHLYAWFFYGMMTLFWYLTKDYQQAFRYKKKGLIESQGVTFSQHMTRIIFFKLIYTAIFLFLPIYFGGANWLTNILGFVLMQFICGLILAMIFQPAHVVPTSTFPMPNDSGVVEADWAVSQLYNTANFAPKSKLFSWYVGGLNFQVEHHLFPSICHIHYKKIAKIVEQTAQEYNLPYYSYKSFFAALSEHTKMLKNLGKPDPVLA
ncbi:MAG: fatty acid desaturase family protein [Flavobacteriales bacterium]